jgi:hypothetical protein
VDATAQSTFATTKCVCISVNRAGSVPPNLPTDYAKGAVFGSTAGNWITPRGGYWKGILFKAGTSTNDARFEFQSFNSFYDCEFWLVGTSSSARFISNNSSGGGSHCDFYGCYWKFSNTGQSFTCGYSECDVYGGGLAAGSTIPTNLVTNAQVNGRWSFHGVDLSAVNTTLVNLTAVDAKVEFMDCLLHASVAVSSGINGSHGAHGKGGIRLHNCDSSSGNTTYRLWEQDELGVSQGDVLIARSGGANNGTTAWSLKMQQPNFTSTFGFNAWRSPRFSKYIGDTGVSKTLTVNVLISGAATPDKNQVWMETETLESSASPLSTISSTITDNGVTTDLATTTDNWTSGTIAARGNSTAYVVGDVYKAASNPNRVFLCTGAGTSAGSEPGAVAAATDGSASFLDGGATIRAMNRCKLTYTWTPQRKGFVHWKIALQIASGTMYVDPKGVIT